MKQTAVEWLLDRIEDVDNTPEIWEQIKVQAKEMEKKQIIDAYDYADINSWGKSFGHGKTYYNETYGSKGSDGKCPNCGAMEVDGMSPRTIYECGSSDYDQRPNTFKQSEGCKGSNETKTK